MKINPIYDKTDVNLHQDNFENSEYQLLYNSLFSVICKYSNISNKD